MYIKEVIDMLHTLKDQDKATYAKIKDIKYLIVNKATGSIEVYEHKSDGTFTGNLNDLTMDRKSVFKELAHGKEAVIKYMTSEYAITHPTGKLH